MARHRTLRRAWQATVLAAGGAPATARPAGHGPHPATQLSARAPSPLPAVAGVSPAPWRSGGPVGETVPAPSGPVPPWSAAGAVQPPPFIDSTRRRWHLW